MIYHRDPKIELKKLQFSKSKRIFFQVFHTMYDHGFQIRETDGAGLKIHGVDCTIIFVFEYFINI